MAKIPVVIEPLGEHHDRGVFKCGEKFIDSFFAKRSLNFHQLYKARAYVATRVECTIAVGFYTLSLTSLATNDSPEEATAKYGTWAVPLVYLGQIGVHEEYQHGGGIGSTMMFHAFEQTLAIAEMAGTYGLMLDALDEERAKWYEGLGFKAFDVEADGRIKMVCPLGTIRAAMDAVAAASNDNTDVDVAGAPAIEK